MDTNPFKLYQGGLTPYYTEPSKTAVRIPDLNHRLETPNWDRQPYFDRYRWVLLVHKGEHPGTATKKSCLPKPDYNNNHGNLRNRNKK